MDFEKNKLFSYIFHIKLILLIFSEITIGLVFFRETWQSNTKMTEETKYVIKILPLIVKNALIRLLNDLIIRKSKAQFTKANCMIGLRRNLMNDRI